MLPGFIPAKSLLVVCLVAQPFLSSVSCASQDNNPSQPSSASSLFGSSLFQSESEKVPIIGFIELVTDDNFDITSYGMRPSSASLVFPRPNTVFLDKEITGAAELIGLGFGCNDKRVFCYCDDLGGHKAHSSCLPGLLASNQAKELILDNQSHTKLFGDIIKIPSWLGIDLDYVSNSVAWDNKSWYAQQLVASIHIAFDQKIDDEVSRSELSRWSFDSTLGYASGDSVAPFVSLSPANFLPQQIYGYGNVARLYSLSLTRDSRPSSFFPAIKIGKLNSYDDFASNYFYCSYMSLAFCGQVNSPMFASKAPFAPVNNYGAVASWTAKNKLLLKYGIYQLNTESWNPGYHGLDFSLASPYSQGAQQFFQIDYVFNKRALKSLNSDSAKRKFGYSFEDRILLDNNLPDSKIQIGGWYGSGRTAASLYSNDGYTSCHHAYCKLSTKVQSLSGAGGIYAMANSDFSFFHLFHDGVVWANVGFPFDSYVQSSGSSTDGGPSSFAVGFIGKGLFRGRPFDEFVVGYSRAFWSQLCAGSYSQANQNVVELGYRFMIGKGLVIQPGMQYIVQHSASLDSAGLSFSGYGNTPAWLATLQIEYKF